MMQQMQRRAARPNRLAAPDEKADAPPPKPPEAKPQGKKKSFNAPRQPQEHKDGAKQ